MELINNGIYNGINENYNLNIIHPIIINSQEYLLYKKYISIHSEDRNIIKYPDSDYFEIELPEDYLNVISLRLTQWSFPSNYSTFSIINNNITMTFKINNPYNPSEHGVSNLYLEQIFEALYYNKDNNYLIAIEEGFYNPTQMITELTNKFNFIVSNYIKKYFVEKGYTSSLSTFIANGGYNNFIIVYNNVGQKIWFGNKSDGFILTNEISLENSQTNDNYCYGIKGTRSLPDFSNFGLPGYLGLTRCNKASINSNDINISSANQIDNYNDIIVPRFFYGDVFPGDNGFWLLPNIDYSGSFVNWLECPYKINFMGEAFFYIEIDGHNCIDETSPYNVSNFTLSTNQTNGIVNSSFSKIPIPTSPISQFYGTAAPDFVPYKFYYPPAERIRKLKFKFRYHDGTPVRMGLFNFSFMIEFVLALPQILKEGKKTSIPDILINKIK
jgi:hypothetical protein